MPFSWVGIKEDWCKACGLCLEACKPKVLRFSEKINAHGYHPVELIEAEKCSGCKACALVCPEAAIEVYREKGSSLKSKVQAN